MRQGRCERYGTIYWYKDDILHREDGPAIEGADGSKRWYLHGDLHRLDGPAIETAGGSKHWYVNDLLHRLDGPAVELANGHKEWWVNGQGVDVLAVFGYLPSVPLTEEEQMLLFLSS